ncbi:M20 family metallopeptidase [soil metagenome]
MNVAGPLDPLDLDGFLAGHGEELVAFRRQLHSQPELSWQEHRTTSATVSRLEVAGLAPEVAPTGTGVLCDLVVGHGDGPTVVLRGDIDALPMDDDKDVSYRSEHPGACHACGHDVHATVVLGAALALARLGPAAPAGRVRFIFQPAEEDVPGGASALAAKGVMEEVDAAFSLHCDPGVEVGHVGLKVGPVTSAADRLEIRLHGPGGHTARPHLTVDLVHVAARVVNDLPAGLARLTDVRDRTSLVFGAVNAGHAPNVIPTTAVMLGSLRAMGRAGWDAAPQLIERLLASIVEPYGATYELDHQRGSPPVDNDLRATELMAAAATHALGEGTVVPTEQSAGGEDFSWLLERTPGCYARLGVGRPGAARRLDLHAGDFDVDEAAIGHGVRLLAQTAYDTLATWRN